MAIAENSGIEGEGVNVETWVRFDAGKIGDEITSGTLRFSQLGSWICTVEMSRLVTKG